MFLFICEILGVVVGALTGSIASSRVKMDLFGVITCGTLCALGGGTIRDILMDVPIFWMTESGTSYLYVALLISLIIFFAVRRWTPPLGTIRIADALTLALFAIIGAKKALMLGFSPAICVAMGTCTGIAGGIMRDLATGNVPYVFRPGELYATAAILGCIVFLGCGHFELPYHTAFVAGFFVVLVVRIAAIHWNWSLPSYRAIFDSAAAEAEEHKDDQ